MSFLRQDALVSELLAVLRADLGVARPSSVEAAHLVALASLRSLVPSATFVVAVAHEYARPDAVSIAVEGWPVLRNVLLSPPGVA